MTTLSEANIPLVSEKSNGNENIWSLASRFRSFIPIPLGLNEYLAANILKENLKIFKDTPFNKEVDSLIEKIKQILPEDIYLELEDKKSSSLYEDYSTGEYDYSAFGGIINDIVKAIINKNICLINYQVPGRENSKEYKVEPEKMIYYNGVLYAIVYLRKIDDFLSFAIQRIKDITVTSETFPDDHNFNKNEFKAGRFGLHSGDEKNVRLRFDSKIKHYIENRKWHHSQQLEYDEDDNLKLKMKVGLTPELISWILSWRSFVKVLEPEELVDKIKDELTKISSVYSN